MKSEIDVNTSGKIALILSKITKDPHFNLSLHEADLFIKAGLAAIIAQREVVNDYVNGKR